MNSISRSSGTTRDSTESKIVQDSFSFAASTHFKPAFVIRLFSISNWILSLLTFDQVLFFFLLLKYWIERSSSSDFLTLSIQPKHSASSTACVQLRLKFSEEAL